MISILLTLFTYLAICYWILFSQLENLLITLSLIVYFLNFRNLIVVIYIVNAGVEDVCVKRQYITGHFVLQNFGTKLLSYLIRWQSVSASTLTDKTAFCQNTQVYPR